MIENDNLPLKFEQKMLQRYGSNQKIALKRTRS